LQSSFKLFFALLSVLPIANRRNCPHSVRKGWCQGKSTELPAEVFPAGPTCPGNLFAIGD
jgi:hypothetical protein